MPTSTAGTASYESLIEAIYTAGLQPERWPDAVEAIRGAMNWSNAVLATPEVAPDTGGVIYSKQIGAADLVEYQKVSRHCVWTEAWARAGRPVDHIVTHAMIAPEPGFTRSPVFQEYFKPRGMIRLAGAILSDGKDGRSPKIGLHLSAITAQALPKNWTATLKRLIPHLKRSLDMNALLAERDGVQRASFAALERLSSACVLIGRDGRVIHLNAAAENLATRGDGLRIEAGCLRGGEPGETEMLERLIASTVRSGIPDFGGTVSLRRRESLSPLGVTALPLSPGCAALLSPRMPAALLLIHDPDAQNAAPLEPAAKMFELTPAETKVLAALMEGHSPAEIASRLEVGLGTVRTHLHRLFEKTGTRRQSDLMMKVTRLKMTVR